MEPATLALTILLAIVGAVIGVQIVTSLGVTPNTSIIGVLIAILVSRVPLAGLGRFRSVHRQNLVQTTISAATFGAANSLLVPIGIPMLLGRPDLVWPMLVGAALAMLIDLAMLYWFFDSTLFPARAPWPLGIATAEAIFAGDQGGQRGRFLLEGALAGAVGSSGGFGLLRPLVGPSGLPMAALGLAFLGNIWALTMFGLGLLVRAYAPRVTGVDVNADLLPHGMMIGAGAVALLQAAVAAFGDRPARGPAPAAGTTGAASARATLTRGLALYLLAGLALLVAARIWSEMSMGQMLAWVGFAAVACIAAELIVGFSAMHAGWFPAFATALVFLILALLAGFPTSAAALLAGFVAAGGPAFADAGYDFKTGWQLRGLGRSVGLERDGRRQQLVAALIGFVAALIVVALVHGSYFRRDVFPPVDRVYAATIGAGLMPGVARRLALWALPGALLQLIGGPSRQLGVLFATGLLILNPGAGWAVLAGVGLRALLLQRGRPESPLLAIVAAGLVAGDAIWAFGDSLFRM